MVQIDKILDVAIEQDASDIHLICGMKPILRVIRELKPIEDWTLSEDRLSLSKTFDENQTETIQLSDLAGNIVETTVNVQSIEPSEDDTQNNESTTNTITGSTNNYKDDTVANTILPNAGLTIIIKALIVIVLLGTIGFYVRYRYLKNIFK